MPPTDSAGGAYPRPPRVLPSGRPRRMHGPQGDHPPGLPRHRDRRRGGAADGPAVPAAAPAGGRGRDRRRDRAGPEPARTAARSPRHGALPDRRPALPERDRAARARAVHVRRRPRGRHVADPPAPEDGGDGLRSPRSRCRSGWASCSPACCTARTTSSAAGPCRRWRSHCSSASPCRSPRSPCSPGSSPSAACTALPIGVLALACAAVDDVVAWSLLALVVAVAVGGTFGGVGTIVGLTVVYAAVMVLVVRPLLRRLVTGFRAAGRLTPDALAVVLVGVLVSAFATEEIGVHAIFGAFVFGAVMPRERAGADPRGAGAPRAGQRAAAAAGVLRRGRAAGRHRRDREPGPGRAGADPAASRSAGSSSARPPRPGCRGCGTARPSRWAC